MAHSPPPFSALLSGSHIPQPLHSNQSSMFGPRWPRREGGGIKAQRERGFWSHLILICIASVMEILMPSGQKGQPALPHCSDICG